MARARPFGFGSGSTEESRRRAGQQACVPAVPARRPHERGSATVFVRLLDEGLDDVWAPVHAEHERAEIFRLPDSAPETETWEFAPGSRVAVEHRGPDLFAVSLA